MPEKRPQGVASRDGAAPAFDVDTTASEVGPSNLVLGAIDATVEKRVTYTATLLATLAGVVGKPKVDERRPGGLYVGEDPWLTEARLLELFAALSLEEEIRTGRRDRLGRYDVPCARRDYGRPYVNDAAMELRRRVVDAGGGVVPLPSFKVVLTHDVDWVTTLEPVAQAKAWRYWVARRRGVWFAPTKAIQPHILEEGLERALKIERLRAVRSWWFMLASRYGLGRYSTRYDIRWKSARRFVARIQDAGGTIGLHGSYRAGERKSYRSEARRLAAVTGAETILHRNHYLRFDPLRGWAMLEEAGIRVDSSIGFTSRIGFRTGIASPYHPYDLDRDRVSTVIELPLVYMERPWHLEKPAAALDLLGQVLGAAREVGGTVALLFHPESFAFEERWCSFYEEVLALCDDLGAEFVADIGVGAGQVPSREGE